MIDGSEAGSLSFDSNSIVFMSVLDERQSR